MSSWLTFRLSPDKTVILSSICDLALSNRCSYFRLLRISESFDGSTVTKPMFRSSRSTSARSLRASPRDLSLLIDFMNESKCLEEECMEIEDAGGRLRVATDGGWE